MREALYTNWASVKKWYRYQPLDYVKEYFGVKIGIFYIFNIQLIATYLFRFFLRSVFCLVGLLHLHAVACLADWYYLFCVFIDNIKGLCASVCNFYRN